MGISPSKSGYTLEDLARLSGMEPRTIRAWVKEGLIPAPSKGRNALYPSSSVGQLLAAMHLRNDRGLSLSEIRYTFARAGEDEIRRWAASTKEGKKALDILGKKDTAAEYLNQLSSRPSRDRDRFVDKEKPYWRKPSIGHLHETTRDPKALSHLVRAAQYTLGIDSIPEKARGEDWLRISINPDVYLEVRGPLDPDTQRHYERLADMMREWLVRGLPAD